MKPIPVIVITIIFFLVDYAFRLHSPGFAFLIPILLVFFMITARDLASVVEYVVIVSVVYDVVSGLPFGFFTLSSLIVLAFLQILRRFVSLDGHTFYTTVLFSVIFLIEYLLLTSLLMPIGIVFQSITILLVESVLILSLLFFVSNIVDLYDRTEIR